MHKKINYKASLFKLTYSIVLIAMFFVQLQLKFIQLAYNDFADAAVTSHVTQKAAKTLLNKQGNNDKETYVKLNKRFPASSFYTLSEPVVSRINCTIVAQPISYTPPFCRAFFYFTHSLRGPPVCAWLFFPYCFTAARLVNVCVSAFCSNVILLKLLLLLPMWTL